MPTKVDRVKATIFPVVTYGCESWIIRKLNTKELTLSNCGAGEHSFESPLDSKEIKPVNLKGNQHLMFIGRIDAEAVVPIFWLPNVKSWLTGNPDAGKD